MINLKKLKTNSNWRLIVENISGFSQNQGSSLAFS